MYTVEERWNEACFELPAGADPDRAVMVPAFPIALVEWWSITPADSQWHGGPRKPVCLCDNGYESDGEMIADYAFHLSMGDTFPEIQVAYDPDGSEWSGIKHWIVDDGFHRISAARMLGWNSFPALVYAADYSAALDNMRRVW